MGAWSRKWVFIKFIYDCCQFGFGGGFLKLKLDCKFMDLWVEDLMGNASVSMKLIDLCMIVKDQFISEK